MWHYPILGDPTDKSENVTPKGSIPVRGNAKKSVETIVYTSFIFAVKLTL